jgi:hypothetical protein
MKTTLSPVGTALVALAGTLVLVGVFGCNNGLEGDRCNPDLSHNPCNAGLTCTQPVNCPENYCCPASGPYSSTFCEPGCAGGQASICAAGGDADCPTEGGEDGGTD